MTETDRIKRLFEQLYRGDSWIGVNILDELGKIDAEQAANSPIPGRNPIWEILNHMIAWRKNVMQRLQGEIVPGPEDNYFKKVPEPSPQAWDQTLIQLVNRR